MVGFNWYWNTRWYLFWLCTECTALTQELTCHSVPITKCLEAPCSSAHPRSLKETKLLHAVHSLLYFYYLRIPKLYISPVWEPEAQVPMLAVFLRHDSFTQRDPRFICARVQSSQLPWLPRRVPLHTYTSFTHYTVDGLWLSPSFLFGYYK